jgi:hypothetical protein
MIRKILVVAVFAFASVAAQNSPAGKLTLIFFGSPTCGECAKIKATLLRPIADSLPGKIDLRINDIESDSGLSLAMKMEEKYHVKNTSPQELFFPDTFLLGYESILKDGRKLIAYYLDHPEKWKSEAAAASRTDSLRFAEIVRQRFEKFTFIQITLAGLVDGINPCAIATMIFLISFLAVQKRRRAEVLLIGMTFTASVFLTYLLLGVGAFKALSLLNA